MPGATLEKGQTERWITGSNDVATVPRPYGASGARAIQEIQTESPG